MKIPSPLLAAALLPASPLLCAGYLEHWDVPAAAANGWVYYDDTATSTFGDVPLTWLASGGNPGGHVETPLNAVTDWSLTTAVDYYVAYTYGATHPVDFIANPRVSIDLLLANGADFGGDQLLFWMGELFDGGTPDSADDSYSFFAFNQALNPTTGVWSSFELNLVTDPGAWLAIAENQGQTPADLLGAPQQWGFGILNGTAAPSGTLRLDELGVGPASPAPAPAPPPSALLGAGLAGLLWRRWRPR